MEKNATLNSMAGTSSKACIAYEDVEYDPDTPIAHGVSGTVHQGKWNDRKIAVKVIRSNFELELKYRRQLLRDVELLTELRHHNIIPVFGVSINTSVPLIVMEYADSGSLYSYLRNYPEKVTGPEAVNHLLYQIAQGMLYLHSQEPPVLHGDLRTANCLLSSGILGTVVKITDFGLSKSQSERLNSGETENDVTGSLCWLAPERLDGEKLTKMVDVYAFSMSAYEILSVGKLPFELDGLFGTNIIAAIYNKVRPIRPSPSDPPIFHDYQWSLVEQCWNQDPSLRPSFLDVIGILESINSEIVNTNPGVRGSVLITKPSPALRSVRENDSAENVSSGRSDNDDNVYLTRKKPEVQPETSNNTNDSSGSGSHYVPIAPQIAVNRSRHVSAQSTPQIPAIDVSIIDPKSPYNNVGLGFIELVDIPPQQRVMEYQGFITPYGPQSTRLYQSSQDSMSKPPTSISNPPTIKTSFWKTSKGRFATIMLTLGIVIMSAGAVIIALFSRLNVESSGTSGSTSSTSRSSNTKTSLGSTPTPGTLWRKYTGHTNRVWSLSLTTDSPSRLFSASVDNTAREWDTTTGKNTKIFNGHTEGVYSVFALPGNPPRLFTAAGDKTVKEWDTTTAVSVRTFTGHVRTVQAVVALNGSPPRLFSGSWDNTTIEWDTTNGAIVRTLTGHTDAVLSLDVLPGNPARLFSSSSPRDATVREWDLTTGALVRTYSGHIGYVEHVTVLPGTPPRLFSCGADQTIREWDTTTGATIRTFTGHSASVYAIAVLPGNPPRMFSGAADNTIREWNMNTGETVRIMNGHTDFVRTLAVLPGNPPKLFSGSYDGTIIEWVM
ncbi:hypothetical protein HK098_004180 [Nowakowskiella sp. JEL0407]|nr:hypothetical protein HK098_004180 [Nowakowskiella sp. JEL0407]